MNEIYSDKFIKSLKKFSSIKKRILNKIDKVLQNPLMGEPLKYDLRGLYSVPVAKNFVIVYTCCKICRKKGDDQIIHCHDCNNMIDETVRFFDIGPHDKVYELLKLNTND
ncbi:MAG: type II toxin-antitoxin system RelE/ParE family toxin [Deltaproteobacteria bacterium]|nr:type II toxin-antitoxin system RelE/ParE family toxin [Deltaproteobacteria bacterium]